MDINAVLAKEIKCPLARVNAAVALFDEGATVPFIARYRKEVTGAMDEEKLRELSDRLQYLRSLVKRKEEVVASMTELEVLTEELALAIDKAETLAAVEDIYRPFKPKRRTRASIAKEKGLEPLAQIMMMDDDAAVYAAAVEFVDAQKGVESAEDAIAGAMDIIAELAADEPSYREELRNFFRKLALVQTSGGEGDHNYKDYLEYSEPVSKIPPHRVLAINRGEKEGVLKVSLVLSEDRPLAVLKKHFSQKKIMLEDGLLFKSLTDGYKRLLQPSLEREIRNELTENAEKHAIKVFAQNLVQLLLQPPVSGRRILALDPGFRTGCKVAAIDETGKLLAVDVIFPTPPQSRIEEAAKKLRKLADDHALNTIVIGNGTASRETETFAADFIASYGKNMEYIIVNEAGASVYSASKLAKEEFPDLDLTYRGAVSIGRRLQDPLAELVKIEPKAIGVGQYQHDVDQKQMAQTLTGVVEDCVNKVGVDINTASPSLLAYISGLNKRVAQAIVKYREANGRFRIRKELLKVAGLGDKTFQQCAGFLRIPGGDEPLDNTAVHPESYHIALKLHKLLADGLQELSQDDVRIAEIAQQLGAGVPTVRDILVELVKPGRDIREDLPKPVFRRDVLDIDQLTEGMELDGTVRNVVDFGCFVDIGVHQDGLVHISELADGFVRQPSDVVKVGDNVHVRVISIDMKRGRIALSMKSLAK